MEWEQWNPKGLRVRTEHWFQVELSTYVRLPHTVPETLTLSSEALLCTDLSLRSDGPLGATFAVLEVSPRNSKCPRVFRYLKMT